ncbi:sce7726 family protein [Salinicola avicenniae]|uniref:sce7726 family protein n=1 Tax=Salinicola avicenniae TaxID=2916836 RepID=UPI002073C94A|nr:MULTISPECIES: sce7726 family protein [unclassified Salinicola]
MQHYFNSFTPDRLASIFSRANFMELSTCRDPEDFANRLFCLSSFGKIDVTLGQLFDLAWKRLKRVYRNEYVFKTEVANRIVFGRHKPSTTALFPELGAGNSVVDLAVFNGTSTAYEIKTELDGPFRLNSQCKDYLKTFDKVNLVLSDRQFYKYSSIIPNAVGVLLLNQKGSLRVVRGAASNLKLLDKRAMFQCLRQKEKIIAGEKITGQKLDLPNALVHEKCLDIFENIDTIEAHEIYVQLMRERKTDINVSQFLSALPYSLRVLGSAVELNNKNKANVLDLLAKKI